MSIALLESSIPGRGPIKRPWSIATTMPLPEEGLRILLVRKLVAG